MAYSSSWYWNKYEKAKEKYKKYKDYASDLKAVLDGFSDWNLGSRSDMNTKIKNTVSNLKEAVSGINAYNTNASEFNNAKEDKYDSDSKLSAARSQIQAEYNKMVSERDEAKSDQDYYWDEYWKALNREAKEKLTGG